MKPGHTAFAALVLIALPATPGFAAQQSAGPSEIGPDQRLDLAPRATSTHGKAPTLSVTNTRYIEQGNVVERSGLMSSWSLTDRVRIGVGRYSVGDLPKRRTHVEPMRGDAEVSRKSRGIAAVGLSLSF